MKKLKEIAKAVCILFAANLLTREKDKYSTYVYTCVSI